VATAVAYAGQVPSPQMDVLDGSLSTPSVLAESSVGDARHSLTSRDSILRLSPILGVAPAPSLSSLDVPWACSVW